jgi:hypothetical protein
MGLFDRWRASAESTESWVPPQPGSCQCEEHVENLDEHAIPFGTTFHAEQDPAGAAAMTVAELRESGALEARLAETDEQWVTLPHSGQRLGPFHWSVWLGDESRMLYDDDAPASLDDSIAVQPGVERVEWADREVFWVGAPALCPSGVMAAVVRALDNPRVRSDG